MDRDIIETLIEMGFNRLESETYLYLLRNGSATPYSAGKNLNKPTANVYKAIDTLINKGAVIQEEGKKKICSAVAPETLSLHLEQSFKRNSVKLKKMTADIRQDESNEKIFEISSAPLALAKAEELIEKASEIIVIDVFPGIYTLLKHKIKKAADRGIKICLQVYQPVTLQKAVKATIQTQKSVKALDMWQAEQLNLIIDGREFLLALFDKKAEKIFQAVWSKNLYLSCMLHSGFRHENTIHRISEALSEPDSLSNIREILSEDHFFINTAVPGLTELFSRYKREQTDE